MFKVFKNYFIGGILVIISVFIPQSIFAAELKFQIIPNVETSNTATLVEIHIDPQSKVLNVVDGEIKFSGAASDNLLVEVENGQSILPIWPISPQYDKNKKSISFAGGVPSGFDTEGLLFRLRITPTVSGTLNISYVNGNAYLNDGKGTKEFVSSKPVDINFSKDEKNKINSSQFDVYKYKYDIIILLIVIVLTIILSYGFKNKNKQQNSASL